MITQRIKIGDEWLEVQHGNDKELIEKGAFWRDVSRRTECDQCESTSVALSHYKTKEKGYKYYGVKCQRCGAFLRFGQIQADGSFFLKWDSKFEKYQPDNKESTEDNSI